MVRKKFYITTAIDYVNAEPHIGHAYQKIVADVLARWHRILGEDVWFLTGTDEHGLKIQRNAEKNGKTPKQFCDEMAKKFKENWDLLDVQPNRFIRTTDADHKKLVIETIKKVHSRGEIYKGSYEGIYCVDCETFYTEKDLVDGNCPIHHRKCEEVKEESYFFDLSKYQQKLLDLYSKNPEYILPDERRNEIRNRVKEGLKDLSITRTTFDWGIPFPLDKKHVVYVWFDALLNYVSGAGKNKKYWPADVHLLGKDNAWFHTVIWPAMLMSAGYKLPKTVFVHGFLTFNGEKISKSLGNAISPRVLVGKYGKDSIRYFVCRHFAFGEGNDGDFSEQALVDRHNNELADKLGNLISRVSALIEKNGMQKCNNSLIKKLKLKEIQKYFDNYEIDKALNEIFAFIDVCNEYVQHKKPWETGDKKVLYELADSIKIISILLWPYIPATSEKIAKNFGFKIKNGAIKNIKKLLKVSKIKKGEILFRKIELPKIEVKHEQPKINKVEKSEKIEGIMTMSGVNFGDWEKLDLRVAQIKKVEDIEGADKLYKLELDVGKEIGKRVICAGIKQHYKKDELKNKKIIYFSNLKPRLMKGIESQGMLLAAVTKDHGKVVLISPEKDIELGSRVS